MAFPDLLLEFWEDNVRGACGVTESDVSNALLALDAYGPQSEDFIKELIPDWETLKATYPERFNRAAYFHVASKVCGYLKVKLPQSEKTGADYSYSLQKIDWDKMATDLLALAYENLAVIDGTAVGDLTVISVAEHSPPVFDPLTIEEIPGI